MRLVEVVSYEDARARFPRRPSNRDLVVAAVLRPGSLAQLNRQWQQRLAIIAAFATYRSAFASLAGRQAQPADAIAA